MEGNFKVSVLRKGQSPSVCVQGYRVSVVEKDSHFGATGGEDSSVEGTQNRQKGMVEGGRELQFNRNDHSRHIW